VSVQYPPLSRLEANERIELILESMTDRFFAFDSEWRFTHFQQACNWSKHFELDAQLHMIGIESSRSSNELDAALYRIMGSAEQCCRTCSRAKRNCRGSTRVRLRVAHRRRWRRRVRHEPRHSRPL